MRDFEPSIEIQEGQIYNFLSGNHPDYDGHQVVIERYYRPGDFAPNGVPITIPTAVGKIQKIDGTVLCLEMIFPACWCV
jgi:hypothetical protein